MAFNVNKDLNFGLFSVSQKIGPVTAVIDKVFRKSGPTQEEAEALSAANDQARLKRQNDTVSIPGWPFFNHAQELRRTRGIGSEGQMVIPRMKFTWLMEFRIDEAWLNSGQMITSLKSGNFIRDGAIYIPVKAVDHPQVNFDVETLRSFNRYVKVPKKMEYQPAAITFDDDTTSIIASLRKEYIHFYHHAGDVGQRMGVSATALLDEETAINEYQFRSTGMASALGEDVRSRMTEHPSIGMKMRSDCSKHFFQEIILYDLGMHRDSINAYYFYHPVVTAWGHDGLDYEDRQGKVSINMQFEYESYYDVLGQNNAKVESVLFNYFGFAIPIANRSNDHPTMIDPSGKDQELRTCMSTSAFGTGTDTVPPQIDCTEFGTIEEIDDSIRRLQEANSSGFVDGSEAVIRRDQLIQQRQSLIECENQQDPCNNTDTANAAERTKGTSKAEFKQECLDRNSGANLGADDNIELNFTDEEAVDAVCEASSQGPAAVSAFEANQVEKIQLTQKVIGDLNSEIDDFQFELDQTPITDPTRIAQLEQAIADNEQRVVDLTDAIGVRTNIISLSRGEQGFVEEDEQAPTGGCVIEGGNEEGNIPNTDNEIALDNRDEAEQQFQNLFEEQQASIQEAETAASDVQIMENIKSSPTLAGSQDLSDEAKQILTANGGDVDGAIFQRTADKEAAETNVETIENELVALGNALNRAGGSTEVT